MITHDLDLGARLQPVPRTAVFRDPEYYIWCGSMVRGDDGLCHLYTSRWPRALGFAAWVTHSEIAHAVAAQPLGPYTHRDVALPARGRDFWDGLCTHNPTILRFGSKYYLYYMGNTGDGVAMPTINWTHRNHQRVGVAVADHPNGPWQRFDQPLIAVTPGFHDALMASNPSVCARPEGGYLMVYKAVDVRGTPPFGGPVVHVAATSASPTGPFTKHPAAVFAKAGVAFPAEDPFIWWGPDRYWAVVKDNAGHFTGAGRSLVLFESADGLDWRLARHPLVSTLQLRWDDGTVQPLAALERPQVFLEAGRPAVLFRAASADPGYGHSFNLQIPLRGGGLPAAAVSSLAAE
jgi:hypothetical protein